MPEPAAGVGSTRQTFRRLEEHLLSYALLRDRVLDICNVDGRYDVDTQYGAEMLTSMSSDYLHHVCKRWNVVRTNRRTIVGPPLCSV